MLLPAGVVAIAGVSESIGLRVKALGANRIVGPASRVLAATSSVRTLFSVGSFIRAGLGV